MLNPSTRKIQLRIHVDWRWRAHSDDACGDDRLPEVARAARHRRVDLGVDVDQARVGQIKGQAFARRQGPVLQKREAHGISSVSCLGEVHAVGDVVPRHQHHRRRLAGLGERYAHADRMQRRDEVRVVLEGARRDEQVANALLEVFHAGLPREHRGRAAFPL